MANSPRIVVGVNQDNTGRTITQDYRVGTGTSYSVALTSQATTVNHPVLTGNTNFNVDSTNSYIGDTLRILIVGATSSYNFVLGDQFASTHAATVSITANKYAMGSYMYNGTVWVGSLTVTV